jgi:hypothetical protein
MEIKDLIDGIKAGDVQSSNNTFNDIMADKINSALDVHKQEIAGTMYGTAEQEPTADENV